MATYTLAQIAKFMRDMDICMMVTNSTRGAFNSRPMSNNGDVKFNGDLYFFTYEGSKKIKELEANPNVMLNFEGKQDLYLSVSGKVKMIRQKARFEEHWVDSLNRWFKDGVDTPGVVLLHVKANYVQYWQREKEGKIKL